MMRLRNSFILILFAFGAGCGAQPDQLPVDELSVPAESGGSDVALLVKRDAITAEGPEELERRPPVLD